MIKIDKMCCEDPKKCAACGWNPAVARRRLKAKKAAPSRKMNTRRTETDGNDPLR